MSGMLELARGPYDVWNVLGGVGAGGFGVAQYLILRRHFKVTLPQKAGDDEDMQAAARAMWRWIGPLTLAFSILLALVGFFEFGSILRDFYGSS